jgi:hypothetical protein
MLVALRMATNAGQDRNYHYALIGLLNFLRFKFSKDRRPPGYDLKIDSPLMLHPHKNLNFFFYGFPA